MGVRLLRGDPTLLDEGLHEGVVAGDLVELAVAQEVTAGVADVAERETGAGEQDGGECGAHPVEFGRPLHLVGDGGVAAGNGRFELAEQVTAGFVVVERLQGLDDELAGDLAGRVSAHAVGEREQTRARVHGVLVVGADQPAVTPRDVAQDEGHGRSSITVLPIRIGVARGTFTAVVTLPRSR